MFVQEKGGIIEHNMSRPKLDQGLKRGSSQSVIIDLMVIAHYVHEQSRPLRQGQHEPVHQLESLLH
jgi:hypothetical protein